MQAVLLNTSIPNLAGLYYRLLLKLSFANVSRSCDNETSAHVWLDEKNLCGYGHLQMTSPYWSSLTLEHGRQARSGTAEGIGFDIVVCPTGALKSVVSDKSNYDSHCALVRRLCHRHHFYKRSRQ